MCTSLYLAPAANARLRCTRDALLERLRSIGLAGAPLADLSDDAHAYAAGAAFARHVVFAGCSPHLRFAPATPGDRCFNLVLLHGPWESPRLLTGKHTTPPRCPSCGHRLRDWRARLDDWVAQGMPDCPRCGTPLQAPDLDWRQQAASGRFLVEIRNVFPGEAVPGDRLLQALRETSGQEWSHAWSDAH